MDDTTFAAELDKLRPFLARYARRLTEGRDLADDLVQDALVRAWEHRHEAQKVGPWLSRILYSTFVDDYRRRQLERYRYVSFDAFPPDSLVFKSDDMTRQVERRELIRLALTKSAVRRNLGCLLSRETTAVLAERHGLNHNTLRRRIHRLRERLRREFCE